MADLTQTVDLLSVLADPTRVRLLSLLEDSELSVAELTRVTNLPQSRVSTHLRKLKAASLVRDRRDGSSSFYGLDTDNMGAPARELWALVHGRLDDAQLAKDLRRREAALAARTSRLRWPDEVAGQMERHYSPGRTWEATARALLGFLELGSVLDIGSGDGVNAELLAPRAERVTCLDLSERVITAARRRLERFTNVDFCVGDMHDLPFASASFDAVLLLHTLTYSDRPQLATAEASRVLRPGGALAAVTLVEHEHTKIAAAYDHVNLGFRAEELEATLAAAGLDIVQCAASSRERRKPYFQVLTAFARKPQPPP
ncbi:HTH-type transcriptional regulator KmtR [Enhygromyxa salina]|uniref:HTH-type transcriptional regulator KmtR n=1 Tax=Enhygromyxa salina TaxID=215803 RepID=A0A2S9YAT5_9BACT|nr:metalloregulator ArsR/SmtB family transcription factor [Enhygromyxa salina]PRQ02215.1 HTH-type transcriptional regulator KmtR [Enhygromyxa salina]